MLRTGVFPVSFGGTSHPAFYLPNGEIVAALSLEDAKKKAKKINIDFKLKK